MYKIIYMNGMWESFSTDNFQLDVSGPTNITIRDRNNTGEMTLIPWTAIRKIIYLPGALEKKPEEE